MARMRVFELAREFGISSKEMLEELKKMNIPAKSHASTLVDAYVDKVRKELGPEMEARKKAAEEAARKEAEEKAAAEAAEAAEAAGDAAPEAAQADAGKPAEAVDAETDADAGAEDDEAAAKKTAEEKAAAEEAARKEAEAKRKAEEEAKKKAEEKARKEAAEKERIQREKDKAARDAELAAREKERAKREQENADKPKKKVLRGTTDARMDSLLSQIEAESKRLEAEKEQAAAAKKAEEEAKKKAEEARRSSKKSSNRQGSGKSRGDKGQQHREGQAAPQSRNSGGQEQPRDNRKQGGKGNKGGAKQRRQERYDDAQVESPAEGDRYSKMADKAERLQHQKIIEEAKAAMAEAAQNEGQGRRKKRKEKREAQEKKRIEEEAIEKGIDPSLMLDKSVVQITTGATVQEVADALEVNSSEIVKRLFLLGTPLTVTQTMSDDLIELIADDLGRRVRIVSPEEEYQIAIHDTEEDLKPRPPVVTVMGHVDHGKTSLLDAIRHTGVAEQEAGGITQAIGASVVSINGNQITFIDTPGHEAFTAMRARGAKITDIVVLVVAADDGVMPQTVEAINHAKAANVPIVVAINKIDKPGANPQRVKQELTEYSIVPEEWGGDNMFVEVSAKKKIGIEDLLETIILQAEVLELKANPDAPQASGYVIEAKLDKGRGPVATVLVHRGTLRVGDAIVAGTSYGRVRALINPKGEHVQEAKPSDPVEVLGLNSVPAAADEFRVFDDERDARNLAEDRALRERLKEQTTKVPVSLDDFFNRIEEGKIAELNLVVKADTQGSIEALNQAFEKMDQSEVRINVIHAAVGGITETDVTLAAASDAIIIGFGVRPQPKAKQLAAKEKVDIRTYRIIYKAIDDINAARVGLLKPDIVEVETATIEVRETFKIPKVGTVAGCLVQEGEVSVTDEIRVVRDGTIVHEGKIGSLQRFSDPAKSVKAGYECGISIEDFQDVHIGDILESYRMEEVAREA